MRKKRLKAQTFSKPTLRVGKAKPKPSNHTETSFRSKSIVLATQSLHSAAPSAAASFAHALGMLTHHSVAVRRDALGQLLRVARRQGTSRKEGDDAAAELPVAANYLPRVLPLTLDESAGVRQLARELLRGMPGQQEVELHAEQVLLYVHSGMTHLSAGIRADSSALLDWLLGVCGSRVVELGDVGWGRTIEGFLGLIGWDGFVQGRKSQGGNGCLLQGGGMKDDGRTRAKHLAVFAEFLSHGLTDEHELQDQLNRMGDEAPNGSCIAESLPWWSFAGQNMLPRTANPYGYLNLFDDEYDSAIGTGRVGGAGDQEARLRSLILWRSSLMKGVTAARQEGGEVGRSVGRLEKLIELIPAAEET